jgi:hypothetical protein
MVRGLSGLKRMVASNGGPGALMPMRAPDGKETVESERPTDQRSPIEGRWLSKKRSTQPSLTNAPSSSWPCRAPWDVSASREAGSRTGGTRVSRLGQTTRDHAPPSRRHGLTTPTRALIARSSIWPRSGGSLTTPHSTRSFKRRSRETRLPPN